MNLKFFASYRDFDQQFLLPSPFSKKCCIPRYDPPSPICPAIPRSFSKRSWYHHLSGQANNYHIDIQNLIRKKRITHTLASFPPIQNADTEKSVKGWIRLPFLGKLSTQISRILRQHNFKPAFYTINNLKKLFSKLKDHRPAHTKSGIYINWNVETAILFILDRLDVMYSRESMSMKTPGEKRSLRN